MPFYLFSNNSIAIRSPDEEKDEPSTSDNTKPVSTLSLSSLNQTDSYEEKIEPSENDFDLEPAEPTELAEPIETTENNSCIEPPTTQSEENLETTEAMPTAPCVD